MSAVAYTCTYERLISISSKIYLSSYIFTTFYIS